MNLFACNHWILFIRAQVTGMVALIRLEFALLHPIYQFLRNGNLWLTPKKKKTEQQHQNSTQRVNRFNYADSNMMLSVITLPLLQQANSQKFLLMFFFFKTNFRKFKPMIAYSWKQQRQMNQLLAQWKDVKVSSPRKEILSPH